VRLSVTYPPPPDPAPHRDDYPSYDAYIAAWHSWRIVRRDDRLNDEELAAKYDVIEEYVRHRAGQSA
jgi:hypothetical protein